MKTLTAVLILMCLISFPCRSQTLAFAKQLGGSADEEPRSMAVDASGNQYVTGKFMGSADFDPGAGVYTLTSAGAEDIFVCKLSSSGNLMWAKQFGAGGLDFGRSVALDGSGNILITGIFSGIVDFDPGPGVFNLTSSGSTDIYICKLDINGNFIWAKQMGGAADDYGTSLTTDVFGNVYTTGSFKGMVDFDPGPGVYNLNALGNSDIFISKLDANGNFVWARSMGGYLNDEASCIKVDGQFNVYTVGKFGSDADFDPGAGSYMLHGYSTLGLDVFISRLDASGNFIWAKQFSEPWSNGEFIIATSLLLDANGNVYVAGNYQGHIDMDTGAPEVYLNSYGNDSYIIKLNSAGGLVWGIDFGRGCQNSSANSIAMDASGNIYATGYFSLQGDFDPGPGLYQFQSYGGNDAYLCKFNPSGVLIWATHMGGTWNYDLGYSIALDAQNNIYSTGYFADVANFYPVMNPTYQGSYAYLQNGTYNLTSAGGEDIYVQKISQNLIVLPVQWLEFAVEKRESNGLLTWRTANEQNIISYIIQNSTDGYGWKDLATINSLNNSQVNTYSYTHVLPAMQINYYRIQQKNIDGKGSYSEIRSVDFTGSNNPFIILNNPVSTSLNIQVNRIITLYIYDNNGRLVWNKEVNKGIVSIDVSRYAKGIYLLKSGDKSLKILVQ
jgi:hypothetical protein